MKKMVTYSKWQFHKVLCFEAPSNVSTTKEIINLQTVQVIDWSHENEMWMCHYIHIAFLCDKEFTEKSNGK